MTGTKTTATFNPLPWQVAPFRDRDRIMLLTGSAGGGKSTLAAEKVHAFCLKYPNTAAIGLRKKREYASKSVVYALRATHGDAKNVTWRPSDQMFIYDNGSKIFIAGMGDDNQRQALRSINGDGSVDIIWGEEANALTEDDHTELMARLRGRAAPWRQIIYSTNPDYPTHWIKRRLMDGGEASVYYSNAADNTYNPDDYLDILAGLTGILGKRLAQGLWVQAEGVVYEQFSDAVHIVEPFPIPAHWRRFRSVDFGYTNPFVCQWWAVDPDGRMYLYREMYMSKRTVKVHSQQINGLSKGQAIETTVADHDAEDRATMYENGIYTQPATKDVSPGIQKVEDRLKIAHDGKPRLFIFRDALVEVDDSLEHGKPPRPISTAQEFPAYVWPKGVDGKAVKEAPVKDNDHGLDALRYAVMYVDTTHPVDIRDNPFYG